MAEPDRNEPKWISSRGVSTLGGAGFERRWLYSVLSGEVMGAKKDWRSLIPRPPLRVRDAYGLGSHTTLDSLGLASDAYRRLHGEDMLRRAQMMRGGPGYSLEMSVKHVIVSGPTQYVPYSDGPTCSLAGGDNGAITADGGVSSGEGNDSSTSSSESSASNSSGEWGNGQSDSGSSEVDPASTVHNEPISDEEMLAMGATWDPNQNQWTDNGMPVPPWMQVPNDPSSGPVDSPPPQQPREGPGGIDTGLPEALGAAAGAVENTFGLIDMLTSRWGDKSLVPKVFGRAGAVLSSYGVLSRVTHWSTASANEKLQNGIGYGVSLVKGLGQGALEVGSATEGLALFGELGGAAIVGWDAGGWINSQFSESTHEAIGNWEMGAIDSVLQVCGEPPLEGQ
jgi:hypothetical protein